MTNPLLSNFELAGQQLDIRDSASYELASAAQQAAETAGATATAAQQAAETAGATATAAQQAAETAGATATDAQQAAEGIISGFNTQFAQIPSAGNLISPYYCKRNNTVYFEFPNIPFLGPVEANNWVSVFTLPKGYRPLSACYRVLLVGGTSSMIIELASSGKVKVFTTQPFTTSFAIYGGFSYLTI